LEKSRQAGEIGSGLEANVTLFAKTPLYTAIHSLGDELRFLLITSKATVQLDEACSDGLRIEITTNTDDKCVRCWHRSEGVGQNVEHPLLCPRCVGNVTGHPEIRKHA